MNGEGSWRIHRSQNPKMSLLGQRVADLGEPLGLIAGTEAVVQRRELDPLARGLAFGPFVAVEVDPHRVRRVRVGLHERRPPLGIEDVPVVVVDEHRLAGELEMRVRVMAAITPAAPRPRLLLRDAEHHHPRPPLPLGLSACAGARRPP